MDASEQPSGASGNGEQPTPPLIFEALRPPSRGRLTLLFIAGPLLWLAALIVIAFALKYAAVVELALAIVFVSFLISIAILLFGRSRRIRHEQEEKALDAQH